MKCQYTDQFDVVLMISWVWLQPNKKLFLLVLELENPTLKLQIES